MRRIHLDETDAVNGGLRNNSKSNTDICIVMELIPRDTFVKRQDFMKL